MENSTWSKMLYLIKIIYLYTLMVSTIYTQAFEKVFGGIYSLIQNRSQSERTIVFSLVTWNWISWQFHSLHKYRYLFDTRKLAPLVVTLYFCFISIGKNHFEVYFIAAHNGRLENFVASSTWSSGLNIQATFSVK